MATPSGKAKKTAGKRAGAKKAESTSAFAGQRTSRATSRTPKKAPVTRKRTTERPAASGKAARSDGDARPRRKSRLSPKDLAMFRELLMAHRQRLRGDVTNMTGEALGRNTREASGNLSAMPIHMADVGGDYYEQEFTLNLIENERELLREIDEALTRIDEGTYGICIATGRPIGKARLKAKPWAKYCIEYARMLEKGLVHREL
jgi:DnaK suppressor protein